MNTKKERLLGFLSQQSQFLFFQKNSIIQQLQNLENRKDNLLDLIEENEEKIKIKNYAIELLEMLKEYKLSTRKNTILNIVNTALSDIFNDSIRIDIEQEIAKNGNIKYNIVFYQQDIAIAKNDELLESNGGGVLAVISILFKILIGYLYSKNKLYIFDESFAQVSPQYRERLSLFLRQFTEKYNFTIILVSQTSDLNKFAHIEYNVNYKYDSKNIKELYIENQRENRDEVKDKLDLYELNIKNFQSIKNAKFIYQGFTVISGPNNCGKSASLRAFKSIIFNDFKEKYQRLNSKITEIILKRFSENESKSIKEVKLIYKSKKIIFELDGEQYLGKNLAADILKNYIEKNFGLKFIDIKSLYKNIKGDLRKQVENIAYNSQHDSLFLIGNKSNDIEKVFNFLFNTETITAAIAKIKEEIFEINDILKEYHKELNELNWTIESLNFELDFIDTLYKTKIIKEYIETRNNLIESKSKLENLSLKLKEVQEQYSLFKSYNDWIEYFKVYFKNIKLYSQNDKKILQLKNDLTKFSNKKEEIEELYKNIKVYTDYLDLIKNNLTKYFNLKNQLKIVKIKIKDLKSFNPEPYKDLEKQYQLYLSISDNVNIIQNIINQKNYNILLIEKLKKYLKDNEDNLNKEFDDLNIVKCSCCDGLGYHLKL